MDKMSVVFGRPGYRFVEINVVKTIFGASVLLPFLLMFRVPIELLLTESASISLVVLLLVFSRMIGSLIIELIQELVLLPILKRKFVSIITKKGYHNREELLNFPPHRMWKEALFKKTKEEIIVLVCIVASLIILWTTFNVANSTPILFKNLPIGLDRNQNYQRLIESLGEPVMFISINILFSVFVLFTVYLLYQALFPLYIEKEGLEMYSPKKSNSLKKIISSFPFFLLLFPLIFPIVGIILSYLLPNQTWFNLVYLLILFVIISLSFLFLRFFFPLSNPRKREEKNSKNDKNITKQERSLDHDFISYYTLYYDLLNPETGNIKLVSQLYLISAIHAFKLLSSRYEYYLPEKVFQEQKANDKKQRSEKGDQNYANYATARKLLEFLTKEVTEDNFDTAIRFFLGQVRETSLGMIASSNKINPILYLFREGKSWESNHLLSMLEEINLKGNREEEFLSEMRQTIEKELYEYKNQNGSGNKFLKEIDELIKDNEKEISVSDGFLHIVLLVAKNSRNERRKVTCTNFWNTFIGKKKDQVDST